MKKLLITLIAFGCGNVFAMTTVNIDSAKYMCNGIQITSSTPISTLQKNCKQAKVILHEEPSAPSPVRIPGGGAEMTMISPVSPNDDTMLDTVKFYTDKGSYMKCYYNNGKYVKCKRTPPKNSPVSATTNSSASGVVSKVSSSSAK